MAGGLFRRARSTDGQDARTIRMRGLAINCLNCDFSQPIVFEYEFDRGLIDGFVAANSKTSVQGANARRPADNMVRRRANLQAIGPNNAPQKHGCFPDVSRIAGAVQGNAAILFCPALIEFRTMSGSGKRADEGATK